MLKSILAIIAIVIICFLLWSPWLGQNNSEAVIFRAAISSGHGDECPEQPWSSQWAPFGRRVHHCDRSWYVGFWEIL
ncbi:TPA: hypothetical protein DF272_06675 [Candidatus Falkowbacteria bacterium]|nr:hypothetical protein [Candidatus Falkowbacteria bacterium]